MRVESIPWTTQDQALLRFYRTAGRRLRAKISAVALSDFQAAYTDARLTEIQSIVDELAAKQKAWSRVELPRAYRAEQRLTAQLNAIEVPLFSAIDRRTVDMLIARTTTDVTEALQSITPSIGRTFIEAQQTMITAEQLKTQIAAGLVEGTAPRELSRNIREALRTGARQQLRGKVSVELAGQLQQTARGQYISIMCRDGKIRRYDLTRYCRLVTKTARSQAAGDAALQSARRAGLDLIRISVHIGACPLCIPFQGNMYSLNGDTPGFPLMPPEAQTPIHASCGHRMLPTTAEALEADGTLENVRAFSKSDRVVTDMKQYQAVLRGKSKGLPRVKTLDAARDAAKVRAREAATKRFRRLRKAA